MSMNEKRSIRRNRRLAPTLEPVEGRVLLSSVAGLHLPDRAGLIAEAARSRRLAVSGRFNGQFAILPTDSQNLLQVTITARGNTGNRRVGTISFQTSFPTTQSMLSSLASSKTSIPIQNLQITAPGGTMTATGTLTINAASRRSPYRLTASITGGTGQFAGATGSLTVQGTSFSLATGQLAGTLRGTIVTHT